MKFENEFNSGYVQSYGPAGTSHHGIYVDSGDIEQLLSLLGKSNIIINREISEVVYSSWRVPLGTIFPISERPHGCLLKGENLEIQLDNYSESHSSRTLGSPRMIGGSSNRVTAVKCKITQNASITDARSSLDKFLETNRIVNNFYNSLRQEIGAGTTLKELLGQS